MSRDVDRYAADYANDYGFEREMVRYRRQLLLERITKEHPRSVVEIGCGAELLAESYLECSDAKELKRWIIVEPSHAFAELARTASLQKVDVIQGLFEDVASVIKEKMSHNVDFVICSGVLHEVPEPGKLLNAICSVMSSDTILHINVPNALSLHRRLAAAMKIISDPHELSDRNVELQQFRVYDKATLSDVITKAGLEMVSLGGYMVKPFTHRQMEAIIPTLGDAIMDGLYLLGKDYPEIASEIYIEARLAR